MRDYRYDVIVWALIGVAVAFVMFPWAVYRGIVHVLRAAAVVLADWYMPALILLAVALVASR